MLCHFSRFSACPQEGHLKELGRVFKYLNKNRTISVTINPNDYTAPQHKIMREEADWSEHYPGAEEELDGKVSISWFILGWLAADQL